LPAGPPGGRLKIALHEAEGLLRQVAAVLRGLDFVPPLGPRQVRQRGRAYRGWGRGPPGLVAPEVGQDDAQPAAEGLSALVAELGQLADQHQEDVLHQVRRVVWL